MSYCLSIAMPWLFLCLLLLMSNTVKTDNNTAEDKDETPRFRGSGRKDKLLVILLDGFRWDYADKYGMSSFSRIKDMGVTTEYLNPVFPAMSFPNYYSLVTGLFVESHGMVMNYMYDPDHNQTFEMLDGANENANNPFWWETAEPLWITATKRGKRSALYLWPGGHVPITGVKPAWAERYTAHRGVTMFKQYIDDALQRFKDDEADLIQIYCEYTDMVGHEHGPDSEEMMKALPHLDIELNKLIDDLKKLQLDSKVNVIIVSDHGMTTVNQNRDTTISLDSLIKVNEVELTMLLGHGAIVGVFPQRGYTEKVYHDLRKSPLLHVWKKEELPERFHMAKNKRTPPIVVLAKPGTFITPVLEERIQVPHTSRAPGAKQYKGFHGYDVEEVHDMRGIFYGFGPGFEEAKQYPAINIVDVYNIMMHFLDMEPLPNNGSWTSVYRMVKSENSASSLWSEGLFTMISCMGGIFIYSFMALFNSLWI